MPYYFYLARCSDGSLYSGYCKDLHGREGVHNAGKGARYTRARLPVRILHSEEFPTRSAAMKREAEVKKWEKVEKEKLVLSGKQCFGIVDKI
ncbi:endonuclease [Candidatus Peregrinibacteria bacterium CG10_big_fil_rev_8_21_14_0_10_49_10]|nr:MAG: endonuclease [Candidatus Peregrinibacteria bacterium CG10_big_fil_rev_8_21_14_0_10_49_10]